MLLLAAVALAGLVYSLAPLVVADGKAGPGGRDDAPATQVQKDDHQRLGTIILADTAGSAAAQMAPGLLYRYRASLGPS